MDYIKIFGKNEISQTIRIFKHDIGMEFGIKNVSC